MRGSPYEAEACYDQKGTTSWIGDRKGPLTATCDDGPHLITHVKTRRGRIAAGAMTLAVHGPPEQTSYTASASRYHHSHGEVGGGRRAGGSGREAKKQGAVKLRYPIGPFSIGRTQRRLGHGPRHASLCGAQWSPWPT
jgi:hypothetical protein